MSPLSAISRKHAHTNDTTLRDAKAEQMCRSLAAAGGAKSDASLTKKNYQQHLGLSQTVGEKRRLSSCRRFDKTSPPIFPSFSFARQSLQQQRNGARKRA